MLTLIYITIKVKFKLDERIEIVIVEGYNVEGFHSVWSTTKVRSSFAFVLALTKKWDL